MVDGSRHKEQERNHNKDTFLLCLRDKKRPVGSSAAEGGGRGEEVRSVSTLASRQSEVELLGGIPLSS